MMELRYEVIKNWDTSGVQIFLDKNLTWKSKPNSLCRPSCKKAIIDNVKTEKGGGSVSWNTEQAKPDDDDDDDDGDDDDDDDDDNVNQFITILIKVEFPWLQFTAEPSAS